MQQRINDQKQGCFQQEYQQMQTKYLQQQLLMDILVNVHKQLPANELRQIARPQTMHARTFIDNKTMQCLPNILNKKCIEKVEQSRLGSNRLKIGNKQKLTIQQYFAKKQFKEVYNKMNAYADTKSFTGRLRSIDSVTDYHHKMFKQLEQNTYNSQQIVTQDSIDSDFQCGNLCRAYNTINEPNDYYLMIENDLNTYGYNIWFFFKFKNKNKGIRTFNLLNMIKKTDNYKKGMQISIFSMKRYQKQGTQWVKGGDCINFGQTNFSRTYHLSEKYHYLSFQHEFPHQADTVYFSLNQPYPYTRMTSHLSLLKQLHHPSISLQIKKIGHSLTDNIIPVVRIWTGDSLKKETILVMARQHPSQTVGSFVCQGLMEELVRGGEVGRALMRGYQVVVVPMVNVDGVVHGSSRCNLLGFDLNRQWGSFLIKEFTPETQRIKKYLNYLHLNNPIKYFFDLHGHGKKLNSFLFSCKKSIDKPSSRLIQLSLNKIQPCFSILDCTYGIQKDKQNTIRSQLFSMGIPHCYTLESSLYGYLTQDGSVKHYTEKQLTHIGGSLLKAMFVMENETIEIQRVLGFSKEELLESSSSVIAKIIQREKDQSKKAIFDNASDSDPDGDTLDLNQRILTCCKDNVLLKTKLKQNQKIKKNQQKKNSNKKQHKKSQLSIEQLDALTGSVKLENQLMKTMNPSFLIDQKKKMSKLSFSNKRITIYSKKIKDKKDTLKTNIINDKSMKVDLRQTMRQTVNKTQIKFINKRLRTDIRNDQKSRKASCSVVYQYPNQGMLYPHKPTSRRKLTYRIKSQQSKPPSTKQIPGVYYQQSQRHCSHPYQKQDSLRALLTDTFSVLKIKPKLSVKRYVKEGRVERKNSVKARDFQSDRMGQKRMYSQGDTDRVVANNYVGAGQSNVLMQMNTTKSKQAQFKFKRFQSFMNHGIASDNFDKQMDSVFYYFPVL